MKLRIVNNCLETNIGRLAGLTNPKFIKLKVILFLLSGFLSSMLLLIQLPSLTVPLLLIIGIWSFCPFYSFAFYMIEHYVEPSFRFTGLWDFARSMVQRKR